MIPGPDQIIECPLCHGLARYHTLVSGNNIGAKLWSDGKQIAPMLPQPPSVAVCSHCGGFYWLRDAKNVGELNLFDYDELYPQKNKISSLFSSKKKTPQVNPEWRLAEYVEEPEEAGYYQAIKTSMFNGKEEEKTLRILAWWRHNDSQREHEDQVNKIDQFNDQYVANLEALLGILDETDDNDKIMKVEILRQLGRFEDSILLLESINNDSLNAIKEKFVQHINSKDASIFRIY